MASPSRLLAGLCLLGSLAMLAPAAAENQPGAEAMAAHRAAYTLSLDRVRENSDIASARGVMLYEVLDACDGWATRQRFTLVLTDRDGESIDTGSDYSTYETKDGRRIRFSLTQTTQGAVTSRISGEAEITPEGGVPGAPGAGVVRYANPVPLEEALPPGTMLPTMHTIRALAAARRGERLLVAPLFDGTNADGAQDSTTVISAMQPPQADHRFTALATLGRVRMRVAFFDRTDTSGGGASAPDYEVGLRYYENGVADELKMDFGDFVIDGRMEELSLMPGGC